MTTKPSPTGFFEDSQRVCIQEIVQKVLKSYAKLELDSVFASVGGGHPRWMILIHHKEADLRTHLNIREANNYSSPVQAHELEQRLRKLLDQFGPHKTAN